MAADLAKFEHIWSALMRVLGIDHRNQYQAGKLYIRALDARQRRG